MKQEQQISISFIEFHGYHVGEQLDALIKSMLLRSQTQSVQTGQPGVSPLAPTALRVINATLYFLGHQHSGSCSFLANVPSIPSACD